MFLGKQAWWEGLCWESSSLTTSRVLLRKPQPEEQGLPPSVLYLPFIVIQWLVWFALFSILESHSGQASHMLGKQAVCR